MLIIKEENERLLYGVWRLDETVGELLASLDLDYSIQAILDAHSLEGRRQEMLAVRLLLKELLGEQKEIAYYSSGRPYLINSSLNISISHTNGYVAVVLHPSNRVGIDIQEITEKVKNVESRLISPLEYVDKEQELIHLLLHFSCKEAMYKALDEDAVDFVEHLQVLPFTPSKRKKGVFSARERRTAWNYEFDEIHYLIEKDFVLVWLSL